MARLFIDGFEGGDLGLWDAVGNNVSINSSQAGRYGNYCLDVQPGGNQSFLKKNIASKSELYVAFRYKPAGGAGQFFAFFNGTTRIGYVNLTANGGSVRAYRGDGTLLATGVTTLSQTLWHLIELHYKPLTSGGVFQVKVNGLLDIDFSGNTTPGATAITAAEVGNEDFFSYTGYFDNIIIDDANWIGDTKIQAIVPTGAGATTQWLPSAGSNYQCVDEIPPSANDFVSTNALNQVDLYQFADLIDNPAVIKCVQVQAVAVKQGAAVPQNLQLLAKSASYPSAALPVPAGAAKGLSALWELDPETSAPWTPDAVNASEFGLVSAA